LFWSFNKPAGIEKYQVRQSAELLWLSFLGVGWDYVIVSPGDAWLSVMLETLEKLKTPVTFLKLCQPFFLLSFESCSLQK